VCDARLGNLNLVLDDELRTERGVGGVTGVPADGVADVVVVVVEGEVDVELRFTVLLDGAETAGVEM
jgi:hypothetical protein